MVMFLLACGWQITHQLPTVAFHLYSNIQKKEIQFGASILAGLLILAGVSSFCDSQIDGLCNGFSVVNYIFQSIVIITILICININISVLVFVFFHFRPLQPCYSLLNTILLQSASTSAKLVSQGYCGVFLCTFSVLHLLLLLEFMFDSGLICSQLYCLGSTKI